MLIQGRCRDDRIGSPALALGGVNAVAMFDVGSVTTNTNGKNIVRWMKDDLGVHRGLEDRPLILELPPELERGFPGPAGGSMPPIREFLRSSGDWAIVY